jgi:hypothetical protein
VQTLPPNYPAGLVAKWTFDNDSPTTAFDTQGNLPGAIQGQPLYITSAPAIGARSISLNGSLSQYILPLKLALPAEQTRTAWVRIDSPSPMSVFSYGSLLSGVTVDLRIVAGRVQVFSFDGADIRTVQEPYLLIHDGFWHLIAMTTNHLQAAIYIDGQLVEEGFLSTDQSFPSRATRLTTLCIGATMDGTGPFFTGDLDDVRLYNQILSPADILRICECSSLSSSLSLSLWSLLPACSQLFLDSFFFLLLVCVMLTACIRSFLQIMETTHTRAACQTWSRA